MTEDLRALLQAGLHAERPPPLGDIVGDALREGRRKRRNRRFGAFGALAVVVVLTAVAVDNVMLPAHQAPLRTAQSPDRDVPAVEAIPAAEAAPPRASVGGPLSRDALTPETVPIAPSGLAALPPARTLTIHSGTQRAGGMQKKATPAAMLHLLTQLLPPGRASQFGVASDNDQHVQVFLDKGAGPGMVRLAVGKAGLPGDERPRGATAFVTIEHLPDNCVQNTAVVSRWPDGTAVELDVASCLALDGGRTAPARPALSTDEAVKIATDPRWGVQMDAALVDAGAARFPKLPVFR